MNRVSIRVAFSPDGKVLATAGWDHAVGLWEMPSGKEIRKLEGHTDNVWPVVFSPDGTTLATAGRDGTIRLWDWKAGRAGPILEGGHGGVPRIAFAPNGKRLASASWDGAVRVWDLAAGKEVGPAGGHAGAVSAVALLADDRRAATAGADGTIRFWDTVSGKEIAQISETDEDGVRLALSADGKTAAVAATGGRFTVRDAATGKERRAFRGPAAPPTAVCLSADGSLLACANADGELRLWDTAEGRPVRTLVVTRGATLLAFSADASLLAGVSGGRGVVVWDAATGQAVQEFDAGATVVQAVFAPDGHSVAETTADGKIILWETLTGKERRRWESQPNVQALAFSPDGRLLAAGGDKTIGFWDVATGRLRGRYPGHAGSVTALAFAADGKAVISGSADSTALVWDLDGLDVAKGPTDHPTDADLNAMWAALHGEDAVQASEAVWGLAAAPKLALPYLRERMKPAVTVDEQSVGKLLARLDDDDFDVREKATHDLAAMGQAAEPFLQAALKKGDLSAEAQERLTRVLVELAKSPTPPGEIRSRRAVEALEHMDGPEGAGAVAGAGEGGGGQSGDARRQGGAGPAGRAAPSDHEKSDRKQQTGEAEDRPGHDGRRPPPGDDAALQGLQAVEEVVQEAVHGRRPREGSARAAHTQPIARRCGVGKQSPIPLRIISFRRGPAGRPLLALAPTGMRTSNRPGEGPWRFTGRVAGPRFRRNARDGKAFAHYSQCVAPPQVAPLQMAS